MSVRHVVVEGTPPAGPPRLTAPLLLSCLQSCGSSPSFAVCNNFLCLDSDDENRESDGDDDDSTSLLWKSLAPDTPSPGPAEPA